MNHGKGTTTLLLCGLMLFLGSSPVHGAGICRTFFARFLLGLRRPVDFVLRPGSLYTGYFSNDHGSVLWTEPLLRQVVEVEGLNSPLVRNYARVAGISLREAREKLAYIGEAPEDIRNFLLVAHSWEGLGSRSPFLSASSSREAASGFGPFPLFGPYSSSGSAGVGASVVITMNRRNLPILKQTSRWSASWELVERVSRAASREDLERASSNERERLLRVWDWLAANRWLEEMTLPYDRDVHSDDFQSVSNTPPRQRFGRLFSTNLPSWADLRLMQVMEGETVIFLHVPPSSILDGRLYDEQGRRQAVVPGGFRTAAPLW